MSFLTNIQLEELFQRFVEDNDYFDDYYLELCTFLLKKGRIGDFELVFNKHSYNCLLEAGICSPEERVDALTYSIIHDLFDVFTFIAERAWVSLLYDEVIIKYKRTDMLLAMIQQNLLYDDDELTLINDIHESFLYDMEPWTEGESIAFNYSKNIDFHDQFLRAF